MIGIWLRFCRAARDEGYAGDLKALWAEGGGVDDGFISLEEFAPDISTLMASFYACLREKHEGSLVLAAQAA